METSGRETKMAAVAAYLGMPEKMEEPEIDGRTEFWLGLFRRLSPSRQYTHGIAVSIPASEIAACCSFCPVPAAPDEVMYVIGAMDDAYLEHQSKQRDKKAKPRKK